MSFARATERLLRYLAHPRQTGVRSDLHIHSTLSDGSEEYTTIIDQAIARDLNYIAFTDHDTVAGIDYAKEQGAEAGIEVIGGVEISAWDSQRQRKVHILGYGLTSNSPAVKALCQPLLERRDDNTRWQLGQMIAACYHLDRAKIATLRSASTALYKQHLMAALTREPFGSAEYTTLYQQLFKHGGIADRDIAYVDAEDAVKAIVQDGGVAVLAHPGQLDSYEIVPRLVEAGLRGIEKYHPAHGFEDWVLCQRLQDLYGLFSTGGSDYHGAFGSSPRVGYHLESAFQKKTAESRDFIRTPEENDRLALVR